MAGMHQMLQRPAQFHQLADLVINLIELALRDLLHIGACPLLWLVERQKLAAFLDGETQATRALEEAQLMNIGCGMVAIAVAEADQADILVVADGLRWQTGPVRCFATGTSSDNFMVHGGFQQVR